MNGRGDDGALHAVDDDFDDRNAFLYATLGVVSILRSGRTLLRTYGVGDGSGRDLDHPVVDALLGVVAVSRHVFGLRAVLDVRSEAPRRPRPGPLEAPVGEATPPRALLV